METIYLKYKNSNNINIKNFITKIARDNSRGCWNWLGSKNHDGYGRVRVNGASKLVHRVVYEHFYGRIPKGLVIDHFICSNKSCCNPEHLKAVTPRENIRRAFSKNPPQIKRDKKKDQKAIQFFTEIFSNTEVPKHRVKDLVGKILLQNKGDCWIWQGTITSGYGRHSLKKGGKTVAAHRYVYEILVGKIKPGLVLDHFSCFNKLCVNPNHLKPSTQRENVLNSNSASAINARKTHCKRGHIFNTENTYFNGGSRRCRVCKREKEAEKRALNKKIRRSDFLTHCINGHMYTNDSFSYTKRGTKNCKLCRKTEARIRYKSEKGYSNTKYVLEHQKCKNGHSYLDATTLVARNGSRICLLCREEKRALRKEVCRLGHIKHENKDGILVCKTCARMATQKYRNKS